MSTETQTPFRIGGVYRNGCGDGPWRMVDGVAPGIGRLQNVVTGAFLRSNYRLTTGRSVPWEYEETDLHLLPGELHQVNGSWVPVEEKPAKSIEFTTALHPITKKVVPVAISYGPGYEAVHFTVDLGRPVRTSIAEPKREPLTWNKPTPFDPFKGFYGPGDWSYMGQSISDAPLSSLQRISPIDRDPKNGSAFLKEMKG